MITQNIKKQILIHETKRWIGIKEIGGDNKGQLVEMWQKTVDQKAQGESWCAAFVVSMIKEIDTLCYDVFNDSAFTKISGSEHVLTMWNKSPKEIRRSKPEPGLIVIWNYDGTTNGHTGIVKGVLEDLSFITIEGNTGPSKGSIERQGDGVYEKIRPFSNVGKMKLLGFLDPW